METFLAAYSALGLAVVIYIARLGIRQQQLQRQLDAFEQIGSRHRDSKNQSAKAA